MIKCFTVILLWPSAALKHRTAQYYTPSVIVLGNLLFCAVSCFREISGSQIVTMFRIARFSLTVFCNIQYVYCAKFGTEYLDDLHLPKCAVYDHCTHNALCLTLFPEKQSNTRCILIYLLMLKYICIHISCTFKIRNFDTNLNFKKSTFLLFT